MDKTVYVYCSEDLEFNRSCEGPSEDDWQSIEAGCLTVIKVENGTAFDAGQDRTWTELDEYTQPSSEEGSPVTDETGESCNDLSR